MSLIEYRDVEQGTEAWHDLRRGMVTASAVGKLLTIGAPDVLEYKCGKCDAEPGLSCVSLARKDRAPIKTVHDERTTTAAANVKTAPPVIEVADNDTSRALTTTLVAERLTGWTEETAMTADMWRGRDAEPFARDIYSGHYHQAVECGFMVLEEDGWALGYSPDGLVGMDGLIEIKSPRAKTHLATILANEVPAQYLMQCQAGLLVSGREWVDFVSYVGGMPLYVSRVYPDPAWHEAIVAAVTQFEDNATRIVATYRNATQGLPKTERIDYLDVELKLA